MSFDGFEALNDLGLAVAVCCSSTQTSYEQYFDFAKWLADHFIVPDRGRAVLAGDRHLLETADVRSHLTV